MARIEYGAGRNQSLVVQESFDEIKSMLSDSMDPRVIRDSNGVPLTIELTRTWGNQNQQSVMFNWSALHAVRHQ